jgi:thymidine phosphorylase
MVATLGGPADFVERASHYLPAAPVQLSVLAPRSGWVAGMATRAIGLLINELGGGRRRASDSVDARVGFTQFVQVGQRVQAGELLAVVHAADANAAQNAGQALLPLIQITDHPAADTPVLITRLPA